MLKGVEDLEINEIADGLVLYDPDAEQVHYLNSSAAVIFALCDGTRSAEALDEDFRALSSPDPHGPFSTAECLEDLVSKGLVR